MSIIALTGSRARGLCGRAAFRKAERQPYKRLAIKCVSLCSSAHVCCLTNGLGHWRFILVHESHFFVAIDCTYGFFRLFSSSHLLDLWLPVFFFLPDILFFLFFCVIFKKAFGFVGAHRGLPCYFYFICIVLQAIRLACFSLLLLLRGGRGLLRGLL